MYVYGLTIAVVRAISILCHLCVIISTKNFSFFFYNLYQNEKRKKRILLLVEIENNYFNTAK